MIKFKKLSIKKYYLFRNENKITNLLKLDSKYKLIIFDNISQLKLNKLNETELSIIKEGILNNAKAICIINDNNLAHITWLAQDEISKKFVDPIPRNLNWKNSAVWGRSFTYKHYRNKKLYSYAQQELQKYLFKKNIRYQYFSIKTKNIISIQSMKKFKPKINQIVYKFNFIFFTKNYYINKYNN